MRFDFERMPPMERFEAMTGTVLPHVEGRLKDSGSNALATGELVVNIVSGRLAEAMNLTCIDAPPGVDEAALAGLATLPSERVAPPRLADSPVAVECRLHQAIEPGPNQVILLARILLAHVAPSCLTDTEPPAIDTRPRRQAAGELRRRAAEANGAAFVAVTRHRPAPPSRRRRT